MSNATDFLGAINRWQIKALGILEEDVKLSIIELCRRIIMDTPVDKSMRADNTVARGDWNSAIGTDPGDVSRDDDTGERALDGVRATLANMKFSEGDSFYFVNYKPYILRIEYIGWQGTKHSTAPYGMFGRHIIEWADIVNEIAASHMGVM